MFDMEKELKTLRAMYNISRSELAKRVNKQRGAIAHLESGFANPTLSTIEETIKAIDGKLELVIIKRG